MNRKMVILCAGIFFLLVGVRADEPAGPSGATVISGAVDFHNTGTDWTITASDQAIINWQNFSIPTGSTVQFIQPGITASVMNRVIGPNASIINGTLTGNGIIFLLNPAGITVGPTGVFNAHGIVATTMNISDAQFLRGVDGPLGEGLRFVGLSDAAIKNFGTIKALAGTFISSLAG